MTATSIAPPAGAARVLIVDDEPGLRQMLTILLRLAKERNPATEVIVMTAHSTVEHALDAMRRGAYDFVAKPFSTAELKLLVGRALEKSAIVAENQRLRARIAHEHPNELLELLGK